MNLLAIPQNKEVFGRYGIRPEGSLISTVVQDATNVSLLSVLESLLVDESRLVDVARLSYRHQLGFFKFVLMTHPGGGCLRLHFWDQQFSVQEDIHSHCAHFSSRIVAGGLSENSFDLVRGKSHARFRYRFDPQAGNAVALADGLAGVCLRKRRTLSAGDTYSKRAMDLHNVSDTEVGTLTVSSWGARQVEAVVLKPRGALSEDCVVVAGMAVDEVRKSLRDITERLRKI
ncbi:MAG: hypothetical protein EON54_10490 [Alcaligenaceae bacterium]|nr:MAG: hypothetical protein EON54_10490 [Alcaligenaceae bacterium]